jgi:hypothetical protein
MLLDLRLVIMMIEILLILILLCMFRTVRIFVGIMFLLILLNWGAHSQPFPQPDPEVLAALLKKFPAMRGMTPEQRDISVGVGVEINEVIFFTPDAHMSCVFKPRKPVKITNCVTVHG